MDKFPLLMNRNSGTVLRLGEDKIIALLEEHMGSRIGEIHMLDTAGIPDMIENIAATKPQGLVVGGGDGTAVYAADLLAQHKIPFGVLPLGTMNLLAQDLGSAPTFEETVQRFDSFNPEAIDTGVVNGKIFLCSAVIGFVPEGAVVREELRENVSFENLSKFIGTIARGMGGDIKHRLLIKSKKEDIAFPLETTALIISNNSFVQKPETGVQRFLRATLTDGKLGVYSASPRDMMDGLKMALSLWMGDWQDHDSVMAFESKGMIVEGSEDKILITLDGEPVEMEGPLHFSIREKSVPVLRMKLKEAV